MAQNINITCPVSPDRINEYVARVAAFYVIALSIVGLITSSWLLFLVLAIDFALRSFTSGDSSPIRRVSKATAQAKSLQMQRLKNSLQVLVLPLLQPSQSCSPSSFQQQPWR
jgi:Domain of unknown function (DUF4395)